MTPLLCAPTGAPLLHLTEYHGRPEITGAFFMDHYGDTDE